MSAEDALRAAGQDRLADALARLDGADRATLEAEVAELDLPLVARSAPSRRASASASRSWPAARRASSALMPG